MGLSVAQSPSFLYLPNPSTSLSLSSIIRESNSSLFSNIYYPLTAFPHSLHSAKNPKFSVLFMARSLSQTIIKLSPISNPRPSSRLLSLRTQSNQPYQSDLSDPSSDSSSDPLLRKLEDAIHRIIVRRSAPDWLPFLPGSSYWVPPSTAQSYGLAQIVEKLANPLTPEESMSTTSARGWPSSEYFVKGGSPHPVEADISSKTSSKSEDEEG